MNKDTIQELISLGLTEREAKLYVAMMKKPEWRASELQRITGMQRARVHQTLEVMASHQYCIKRSEGRFNYYRPTPPEILWDMLTERWEAEIALRMSRGKSLISTLDSVYQEATKVDRSLDFFEIIQTPNRIQRRFSELLLSAKEENLAFVRSPYSFMAGQKSPKKRDKQTDVNKIVIERGVKIKTIMMYEKEIWPFFKDAEHVGEVRIAEYLPLKMSIFDRDSVLMRINTISGQYKGSINEIILHDSSIANACAELFYMYWDKSCPYEECRDKYYNM